MNARDLILAGLILLGCAVLAALLAPADTVRGPAGIVDGDSLEILGTRVRLEDVDAPELAQTCGAAPDRWPCGQAARTALARLAAGQMVHCAGRGHDAYGRLLARCRIGGKDGEDLGAALVAQGLALAVGGRYRREEQAAREAGRGLWSGPFDPPKTWRAAHPR